MGEHARCRFGPGKALLFQALLPQTKTITMPIQRLDLVATSIHKHKQGITERIHRELLLDDAGQTINLLSEVHRCPAQIHRANAAARMHQRTCWPTAAPSRASHSGAGSCASSSRTPGAMTSVHRTASSESRSCTGIN